MGVTTDPDPPGSPKPANEVTTDSRSAASACEPYRELIEQGLTRGRNAMLIWQELVDQHGFAGSYENVKRFVLKRVGSQVPELVPLSLPRRAKKRRWTMAQAR